MCCAMNASPCASRPKTATAAVRRGGLLLTQSICDEARPISIKNVDETGKQVWELTGVGRVGDLRACSLMPQFALRRDGSIVVVTRSNLAGFPGVMILNGQTGVPFLTPAIPSSSAVDMTGQMLQMYSPLGPPSVAADGSTYLTYAVSERAYPPRVVWTSLQLLKIDPENAVTTTELHYSTANENVLPGHIIPDGDGGIVAT